MITLKSVLSNLIRQGKVTLEVPNLDMDELRKAVWNEAEQTLDEIRGVVYEDEMTDEEKVRWIQNRLEHTLANIDNTTENLTAAESQIRDTDMAAAITEHVRNQIILQSGQSMLAQANQIPQNILSLLGA